MVKKELIDGVVAGGELDAFGGGSGGEEGGDGVGLAAALPVRVDAGFDGELEGGAAAFVLSIDQGVDTRAARDELADDGVPGAPCGVVESGGVFRRLEVGVAFGPERVG